MTPSSKQRILEVMFEGKVWRELYGGEGAGLIAAAHELKAPLVVMRQLAMELGETDDPLLRRQISQQLRLSIERSLQLTELLTQASRLRAAGLHCEPIAVMPFMEEILHEMTPLARALGQRLQLRSTRGPLMLTERQLLQAVIISLIDNALQHNSTEAPVEVAVGRRGDFCRIEISDHGPRLTRTAFEAIKNRLGKSPQPVAHRPRSSGLGLLIAEALAQEMAGHLEVGQRRQAGLCVTFTGPISRQLGLEL